MALLIRNFSPIINIFTHLQVIENKQTESQDSP